MNGLRIVSLAGLLAAAFFLPWEVSALGALALALFVPLAPLTLGILLDALYLAPHASAFPWATVLGALATIAALLVRRRLLASIIG